MGTGHLGSAVSTRKKSHLKNFHLSLWFLSFVICPFFWSSWDESKYAQLWTKKAINQNYLSFCWCLHWWSSHHFAPSSFMTFFLTFFQSFEVNSPLSSLCVVHWLWFISGSCNFSFNNDDLSSHKVTLLNLFKWNHFFSSMSHLLTFIW